MSNLRQAAQQALEALVAAYQGKDKTGQVTEAIAALRAALAEPEQKPVGYWDGKFSPDGGAMLYEVPQVSHFGFKYPNIPVYAAPTPQPEQKAWFTVSELNEWATKLPQTTHWEGCEAVHPECRAIPRKPLTDEMVRRMKEVCTSMEMRGAFADGWLSAEAAHGIKENI